MEQFLKYRVKKTTLNILNYGLVKNSQVTFTDLDFTIQLDIPEKLEKPVLVNLQQWYKTKDFLNSIDENMDIDEFPSLPEVSKGVNISNLSIFDDINDFYPYPSCDFTTRIALTAVYYSKTGVCGTDGHIMLTRKRKAKKDMLISHAHIKLINDITKLGINKITAYENHVKIEFNGGVLWVKNIEGPYPDYKKVLPTMDKAYEIPTNELKSALKTILPYTNKKTNKALFDGNKMSCNDSENNKTYVINLSFSPFTDKVAVNANLFLTILQNTPNKIRINPRGKNSFIGAIRLNSKDQTIVIMPLRHLADDTNYSETVLEITEEKPKKKTVTMPNSVGPVKLVYKVEIKFPDFPGWDKIKKLKKLNLSWRPKTKTFSAPYSKELINKLAELI